MTARRSYLLIELSKTGNLILSGQTQYMKGLDNRTKHKKSMIIVQLFLNEAIYESIQKFILGYDSISLLEFMY